MKLLNMHNYLAAKQFWREWTYIKINSSLFRDGYIIQPLPPPSLNRLESLRDQFKNHLKEEDYYI